MSNVKLSQISTTVRIYCMIQKLLHSAESQLPDHARDAKLYVSIPLMRPDMKALLNAIASNHVCRFEIANFF